MPPSFSRLGLLAAVLAGSTAFDSGAFAQMAAAGMAGMPQGAGDIATGRHASAAPTGGAARPAEPPPAAVPGAQARAPAAPAKGNTADMSPNDALFDAINRGDIASARDALNRGAELGATNILGMTPMELSVDLGRNDISFLLLSMRGDDSTRGTRAAGRSATPADARVARTEKPAPKPVAATKRPVERPVARKPVQTPKLFAGDGGTPLPNAGFLGFDSRQASN